MPATIMMFSLRYAADAPCPVIFSLIFFSLLMIADVMLTCCIFRHVFCLIRFYVRYAGHVAEALLIVTYAFAIIVTPRYTRYIRLFLHTPRFATPRYTPRR